MDTIRLEATERTPELDFDFQANTFTLRGESYPEDVTDFFGEPIGRLEAHLGALERGALTFNFELIYFNSSSAKVIMRLFELLEETAQRGVAVTVNWSFDADDDNMEELGEEFGEDLEAAAFNLQTLDR